MDEKFSIIFEEINDPYNFLYFRKNEKNQIYEQGALDDIYPARWNETIHYVNRKWPYRTIQLFKSILAKGNIIFQPRNTFDGIFFGKLYIESPNGERDVSQILVKSNDAIIDPNALKYAYAAHRIPMALNDEKNDVSKEEENDVSMDEKKKQEIFQEEKHSNVNHVSSTVEILEKERFVNDINSEVEDGLKAGIGFQQNNDNPKPSEENQLCESDAAPIDHGSDSFTEVDEATIVYSQIETDAEASSFIQLIEQIGSHSVKDESTEITKSDCSSIIIPDYMREEEETEIDGDRFYLKKGIDHMRVANEKHRLSQINSLIAKATQIDANYHLINNSSVLGLQGHAKKRFSYKIGRYLQPFERFHNKQTYLWNYISYPHWTSIVLVGEINFFMYLPPICDEIIVSKRKNEAYSQNVDYQKFQNTSGVKWNGLEALIFASNANEAQKINTFCSVTLSKDQVCMDLVSSSSTLIAKNMRLFGDKTKILIVPINRIEILYKNTEFKNLRFIVIDGMHLLREEQLYNYSNWSKQINNIKKRLIITSKYHLLHLQSKNPFLVVKNFLDLAKFARVRFSYIHADFDLYKINVLLDELKSRKPGKCAIICSNNEKAEWVSNFLKRSKIDHTLNSELFSVASVDLMVCSDEFLARNNISDVVHLIHVTLPDNLSDFEQRFALLKDAIKHNLTLFYNKRMSDHNLVEISSTIISSIPYETPAVNKLLLQLIDRKYHYGMKDAKTIPDGFINLLKKCVKYNRSEEFCSNTSGNLLHLVGCEKNHIDIQWNQMKKQLLGDIEIDIMDVISPDEYNVDLKLGECSNEMQRSPAKSNRFERPVKLQLTNLIPYLRGDWSSEDANRVYKLIMDPRNNYQFKAISTYQFNGFTFAADLIVFVRNKTAQQTISMKKWMIEHEIAKIEREPQPSPSEDDDW